MRALLLLGALSLVFPAFAADGNAILNKDCASCHQLKGPEPQTLKELWARKAPDLFYAGNKFKSEWLAAWLQKPQRIRPAGEFYGDHLKRGAKSDEVDAATLKDHVALNKSDALAVTAELMKLKSHDDLIAREKIEPGEISKFMGEIVFDKALGCLACHMIEPDYGGFSGPELYTASKRLQPEYIASFIRNPRAWDTKSFMPDKHVSDENIQKLVRYIAELSKEGGNGK